MMTCCRKSRRISIDRRVLGQTLVALILLYGGGLRPTTISPEMPVSSGRDLISAVGSFSAIEPKALPEAELLTVQRKPYTGGEIVPICISCMFHPASLRTEIKSSAKSPASNSPSLVTFTVDPAYGLRDATNVRCASGLIRRNANLASIFNRASLAMAASFSASAALATAFAVSSRIVSDSFFNRSISRSCPLFSADWMSRNWMFLRHNLKPNTDSPVTPTATKTPKIINKISSVFMDDSISCLVIKDSSEAARSTAACV